MQRGAMQEYVDTMKAYFAPVNRATEAAASFDAATMDAANPDAPWLDAGLVRNFKRTAKTTMGALRTGAQGVAQTQFRSAVDARVSLDFCEWGKLQMALAAGSQHLNVLAKSNGAVTAAQAMLAGSSATLLQVDPLALKNYAAGDLVVVDVDYAAGMTLLGTGITGATAASGAALGVDAVRQVSLNVGCVANVSVKGLVLDAALPGGAPAATAKIQKVVAFADREGASFLQEWSALFVGQSVGGGVVAYYYPRLQAAASAEETMTTLAEGVTSVCLHAEFAALATVDANDGESVVCYRTLIPAANTPAY